NLKSIFNLIITSLLSYDTTVALSKKQRKILDQIFEQPVRSDVVWTDIESLLEALGAEISEGRGSRVRVALKGVRALFHRPHPRRETDKGAVVSVRRFLSEAGVENDEV
ncbi:MAG: type II toxin-antitoxin system HicA family toxin, partial [Microcystis aeruginosa]